MVAKCVFWGQFCVALAKGAKSLQGSVPRDHMSSCKIDCREIMIHIRWVSGPPIDNFVLWFKCRKMYIRGLRNAFLLARSMKGGLVFQQYKIQKEYKPDLLTSHRRRVTSQATSHRLNV